MFQENTTETLHFVRRNDILLQCGMTRVVPLPSLGVSSLDLGRSDPFERPFFFTQRFFLLKEFAIRLRPAGWQFPGRPP
jgi:hypothetical protein